MAVSGCYITFCPQFSEDLNLGWKRQQIFQLFFVKQFFLNDGDIMLIDTTKQVFGLLCVSFGKGDQG